MNGMFGLLVAANAQQAAAEARLEASRGALKATATHLQIRYLEDRLDKLLLVNMAMWELLKDRTELTEEDLMAKVQEVDLRDGRADGKISKTVAKCPKCGRTMSPRHKKCLYCGASKLNVEAFDAAT